MPYIVINNAPLPREPVGLDAGRPEAAEAPPGPVELTPKSWTSALKVFLWQVMTSNSS